jgi:hypothetical protein
MARSIPPVFGAPLRIGPLKPCAATWASKIAAVRGSGPFHGPPAVSIRARGSVRPPPEREHHSLEDQCDDGQHDQAEHEADRQQCGEGELHRGHQRLPRAFPFGRGDASGGSLALVRTITASSTRSLVYRLFSWQRTDSLSVLVSISSRFLACIARLRCSGPSLHVEGVRRYLTSADDPSVRIEDLCNGHRSREALGSSE